jgi:hypothetical protein
MNNQSKPKLASTSADDALASVTIVPSSGSRRFSLARKSFAMETSAVAVDDRQIGKLAGRAAAQIADLDERGRAPCHVRLSSK